MDPLHEVVLGAIEGDDRAVAELVRRTQPQVWRLCRALSSPDEADDLTQETYVRALRSLRAYRADAPVLSWLLTIARHACADAVRANQRRRRLHDRLRDQAGDVRVTPTDATDELLAALPHDRREAFVLTQIIGLSYEEAADIAGCPIGTIRSRVARARADLLERYRAAEAV